MYYVPSRPPGQKADQDSATGRDSSSQNVRVRLLDRHLICRNAVFSVYLDRLEQPDGKHVLDYLSIIPKVRGAGNVSGVAVLPDYDGKVALIYVTRHPLGSAAWEVPRGFIDAGETAADAALRELKEEVGLETSKVDLVSLGIIAPEPGLIDARVQIFLASGCRPSIESARPKELGHMAVRYFTRSEVMQLLARNEILDPYTTVACLKYSLLNTDHR